MSHSFVDRSLRRTTNANQAYNILSAETSFDEKKRDLVVTMILVQKVNLFIHPSGHIINVLYNNDFKIFKIQFRHGGKSTQIIIIIIIYMPCPQLLWAYHVSKAVNARHKSSNKIIIVVNFDLSSPGNQTGRQSLCPILHKLLDTALEH